MRVLIFALLLQMAFSVLGTQLVAANANGTSLVLQWKSDVLSASVPNPEATKLYTLLTYQSGTFIVAIDITNPVNVTYGMAEISEGVKSLAGVFGEDIGFSSVLSVFSLIDQSIILNSTRSAPAAILYGGIKNSVIAIYGDSIETCLFTKDAGLTNITSVSSNLGSILVSKSLIASSRRNSLIYAVVLQDAIYSLKAIDYLSGTTEFSVTLPSEFIYDYTATILVSQFEDYVTIYSNYTLYFYEVKADRIETIGSIGLGLSAVAVLPTKDTLIGKSDQSKDVYLISMQRGNITQKLALHESDYLNRIFVRKYEERTVAIFTDYTNWYAYALEDSDQTKTEELVSGYVILMSVILVVGMIVSLIYLVCKQKMRGSGVSSSAQPAGQVESGARLAANRRDAYQIPVSRTLDTHLVTDLNDSAGTVSRPNELTTRKLLMCPLTGMMLKMPVVAADGYTYEKDAIEQWLRQNSISPMTREPITSKALITNRAVFNILTGAQQ